MLARVVTRDKPAGRPGRDAEGLHGGGSVEKMITFRRMPKLTIFECKLSNLLEIHSGATLAFKFIARDIPLIPVLFLKSGK